MLLFLQIASVADTVLVRNVPPARSAFEQLVFVAQGITSLLVLLLVVLTVLALLVLRAKADQLQHKLDELLVELRPMTRSAAAMYEDVREVAKNVNEMVEESRDTVKTVNERVRKSVVTLTDRVDELSGIVGRVNASATKVASVATTTVAGIKFGARALGLARPAKRKKKGKLRGAAPEERDERPRLRRRD